MASRSLPSAAPSADRISESDEDGSAATSRPASPCSRVSWRRAEESTGWPETSATTSSGCTSLGETSVTTRPCRSTTIRSASRNISSVSCPDSRIVVPCARSRVISRSTSAASRTPSDAVGSSSSRILGLCAIARATATICRCPPDSSLTGRVVSRSGMPSRSSSRAASLCSATSENRCLRRSLPSITFAATSRLSARARSCQTTRTPSFAAAVGTGATACPPTRIDPGRRRDVARDGPDERGLARAVLPGQGHHLPGPQREADPLERGERAEPHREPGHRELGCPAHGVAFRVRWSHSPLLSRLRGNRPIQPQVAPEPLASAGPSRKSGTQSEEHPATAASPTRADRALRWFRDRTRIEALGRDHGVSRATAYRYVAEAVDVLSEQAPGLAEALERAMAEGVPYVILDGKIFESDRLLRAADQRQGRADRRLVLREGPPHGGNVQAVTRPDGLPLWACPAEPGSRPRHHRRPLARPARPLPRRQPSECPALADSGYEAPESESSSPSRTPP